MSGYWCELRAVDTTDYGGLEIVEYKRGQPRRGNAIPPEEFEEALERFIAEPSPDEPRLRLIEGGRERR